MTNTTKIGVFKKIYVTTTGGNTSQLVYTDEMWERLAMLMELRKSLTTAVDDFVFNLQEITAIHRQ